jgi:[ribosomal protein S18]-alanine N-acetyltransferase
MEDVSTGVTLRPCERRDIRRLVFIEKGSFPDPYSELTFAFYRMNPWSSFVVACVDDSVVGYVIAIRCLGTGTIQSIAVLREFRGRKIGRMLMRSAMDHLTRCRRVDLLVGRANDSAIRLYRSFSFRETGRVFHGYYPDGDDALEFEWKPDG